MDRRRAHARYTAAWRLTVFAGSLAIMYFAIGQLMSDGDIGRPEAGFGGPRDVAPLSSGGSSGGGGSATSGGNDAATTVTAAVDSEAAQQV